LEAFLKTPTFPNNGISKGFCTHRSFLCLSVVLLQHLQWGLEGLEKWMGFWGLCPLSTFFWVMFKEDMYQQTLMFGESSNMKNLFANQTNF